MPIETFGPHLTLDLSECNVAKISDYGLIFRALYELPKEIGMTLITQPYVFPYSGLVPEDEGITGVSIIAESHISFHSFFRKRFVFVDVFSCKEFDVQKAINYFVDKFEAGKVESNTVRRGKSFPS